MKIKGKSYDVMQILGPNSWKACRPDGLPVVIKKACRNEVDTIRKAMAVRAAADIDENVLQRFLTQNRKVKEGDFVVLNYIDGVNVCDALAEYPCESDEIVHAVVHVVRATLVPMLELEKNGLVHMDIHGRNIILSDDNSAGLIDIDHLQSVNNSPLGHYDMVDLAYMSASLLGIDDIPYSAGFGAWKIGIEERIRQCSDGVRDELKKFSNFILLAIHPNRKKCPTVVEAMQMLDDKPNLSEI